MRPAWTTVDQVVARLRKRWETGNYVRSYAAGEPWTATVVPIRGPSASELLDHFDEAALWVDKFKRDSRTPSGAQRFVIEYRTVKSRHLGANEVPARIRIDSFEQLCALLGTRREVSTLNVVLDQTRMEIPELLAWVVDHPLVAIKYATVWSHLLLTVAWIAAKETRLLYLRQIDVQGVDTKFVERHQKLLDSLLTSYLPAKRIDSRFTHSDFALRFGFRSKPGYTRMRFLCPQGAFPAGVSELWMRTEELANFEPEAETVFIVENEITYLAFPGVGESIVIFGSGFGLTQLNELPWLNRKEIVYWGDIDTHGFDILSRLRSRFDSVKSILMDRDTLLSHPQQWVTEPSPTKRELSCLSEPESALYFDLIEDRYGHRIRLEQERVRFSLLRSALEPWIV